jgi:hypothetical protein
MTSQNITTLIRQLNGQRLRGSILNILGALLFFAGFSGGALASEDLPFEGLGGDQCFMFSQLVPLRGDCQRWRQWNSPREIRDRVKDEKSG